MLLVGSMQGGLLLLVVVVRVGEVLVVVEVLLFSRVSRRSPATDENTEVV